MRMTGIDFVSGDCLSFLRSFQAIFWPNLVTISRIIRFGCYINETTINVSKFVVACILILMVDLNSC